VDPVCLLVQNVSWKRMATDLYTSCQRHSIHSLWADKPVIMAAVELCSSTMSLHTFNIFPTYISLCSGRPWI
jgi:hypothetical protein